MSWPGHRFTPTPGTAYLVGAGPGDPELITVRGLRCLRAADVLLHDALIHDDLLTEAPQAQRVFVGKSAGNPGVGQQEIHRLLIHHARRRQIVVRLKGGDPYVFGRGSEEAAALDAAGIPWEVVPAVSSAFGAPAAAGIPLTHRNLARSFAVVTAHRIDGSDLPWPALVEIDTLVVLMGVAALPRLTQALISHGRSPQTPAAVVERGTLPDQNVVTAPLRQLAEHAAREGIRSPATIVIGEVVNLRRSSVATWPLELTSDITPELTLPTLPLETNAPTPTLGDQGA